MAKPAKIRLQVLVAPSVAHFTAPAHLERSVTAMFGLTVTELASARTWIRSLSVDEFDLDNLGVVDGRFVPLPPPGCEQVAETGCDRPERDPLVQP